MYQLRENRDMKPNTFGKLVGTTLYEHRWGPFFVSPVVIGLEDGKAIIFTYDSIGTQTDTEEFASVGTAETNMLGLCEAYYKENLEKQELTDILSNTLVSGIDRDILSGWGGIVYIMSEDKIEAQYIKTKMV